MLSTYNMCTWLIHSTLLIVFALAIITGVSSFWGLYYIYSTLICICYSLYLHYVINYIELRLLCRILCYWFLFALTTLLLYCCEEIFIKELNSFFSLFGLALLTEVVLWASNHLVVLTENARWLKTFI